ncbi:hypothetical protein BJX76DRAFT_361032 [Aspergillus varians]
MSSSYRPGKNASLLAICDLEDPPEGRNHLPLHDFTRPRIYEFEPRDLYKDLTFKGNDHWEPKGFFESPSGGYPHIIAAIIHNTDGKNQSLTRGEVKASVRALHFRYRDRAFSKFDILPILIVSYIGPKHGRILQAHHNGEEMVLQYSPLMSFEKEETAAVSLFVRYKVSESGGPTSGPLPCAKCGH